MPEHTHKDPDEGHEGAVDGLPPGAPAGREVIKPDWANLDEVAEPPADPDAEQERGGHRQPGKPIIDRHR